MNKPTTKCPKHGVSYLMRRNVKTGEIAIACPLCDVEERGGRQQDLKAVADNIANSEPRDKEDERITRN